VSVRGVVSAVIYKTRDCVTIRNKVFRITSDYIYIYIYIYIRDVFKN